MSELEIKANAEQYALKRITSTDLSMQARDKILIQDAYEKGFDDAKNKIEELEKEITHLKELLIELYDCIPSSMADSCRETLQKVALVFKED